MGWSSASELSVGDRATDINAYSQHVRRTARVVALLVLLLGVFWAGRESTHGITAFWEHWWCPIPIALAFLGAIGLLVRRSPSPAT